MMSFLLHQFNVKLKMSVNANVPRIYIADLLPKRLYQSICFVNSNEHL